MEGGLWGLVVVASAFSIQVFVFGISESIGVYNIEFLDYFNNDTVGVSLIASVNLLVFFSSGPVTSFLMKRLGYRTVTLIGSFLVVLGVLLSRFLLYIPALCVCLGFLTGFGSGLVYVPSHVLCGLYYDRHRSLATGIATGGSGFGGAVMPIVVGYLIQKYGWKGSLIVLAGINLHLFVCAALLRPPPSSVTKDKKIRDSHKGTGNVENGEAGNAEQAGHPVFTITGKATETCDTQAPEGKNHDGMDDTTPHAPEGKYDDRNETANPQASNRKNNDRKEGGNPQAHEENKKKKKKKAASRHIRLLTDLGFAVYFLSNLLWNINTGMLTAFIAEFANERGINPLYAAWLVTISGFGCFVGGLIGAVLGNIFNLRRLHLYIVSCLIFGAITVTVPLGSEFAHFAGSLFCGKLSFGVILGLQVVVLTDLIGTNMLGDGMGYLMLSNGIGSFIGPYLAGSLRSLWGTYDYGFYAGSVVATAAGLVMLLIPLLQPCYQRRRKLSQKLKHVRNQSISLG